MSKLAANAGDRPGKDGDKARTSRSRQSTPASTVPISSRIASTARNPQGSRPASPAAGRPIRNRRVAASMRRRCACHSSAACGSSAIPGRSASACNGRCSSPLACSIRRRAAKRSGRPSRRLIAARAMVKATPKPSSRAAWSTPGRSGRRSNRPTTRKVPSTASIGQQAGQTRSHNSAPRARRSRIKNGVSGSDERLVMRHLVFAPAPGSPRRARPEWYPWTAYHYSSAAPG